MGIVRTATAVNRPTLVNTTAIASVNKGVIAMSADRTKLYGGSSQNDPSSARTNTTLYQSTNDGTTWTTIKDFGTGNTLQGMIFTNDGEVLVSTGDNNPTGQIWRSTGWATNPATATWTSTLTMIGTSTHARLWSVHDQSKNPTTGEIMVAEYGPKASSTADMSTYATRVYKSTDHGVTWNVVLNLATRYPTVTNMHVHGLCYDKWWDRWWVTFGDANPIAEPGIGTDGSELMTVLYSDDAGATWTRLPKPADRTINGSYSYQTTTVMALETCVLFGPDIAPNAIQRLPRKGYRIAGDLHNTTLHGGSGNKLLGAGMQPPAGPGLPAFIGARSWNAADWDILVATVDGVNFYELDSRLNTNALQGYEKAVGPTVNGKVVVATQYTGAMQNLVSDLLWET